MRESKCYISVACFHYGGSDLLRFGKFEVLITSQALLSQKQPIFMQNYNFVKNDVFVAKICKYALYESSEGLFCAPRKAANFCHPATAYQWTSPSIMFCNPCVSCSQLQVQIGGQHHHMNGEKHHSSSSALIFFIINQWNPANYDECANVGMWETVVHIF